MTDLNLFFDGGLPWNKEDKPKLTWEQPVFEKRVPVFSGGASIRVNLSGYKIIEPYYAIPIQKGGL